MVILITSTIGMKVLFKPILTIIYIPILLNTTHIYYQYQYTIYVATWLIIGPGLLCSDFAYYAFEQCSKFTHYAQNYAHHHCNYITVHTVLLLVTALA